MDHAQLAFMAFIAVALVVIILALVVFMYVTIRTLESPVRNPEKLPATPYAGYSPPADAKPAEPPNDALPKDDGLSLEDFIPDLNKPVQIKVKQDEDGNTIVEEDHG